jgi:beta-lactamase superfamily II metal-dependent hydrolase
MRPVGRILIALGPLALPVPAPAQVATIDFLDVGQGDAILIRSPEGKAALVDAGPSKEVVSLLKQRGVRSIDLVVVSHHHSDHYGGMDEVIRAFHPRYFLATDSTHTTPHYLRLLRLVRDSGVQAIYPRSTPRKIELGSVSLTVLPQPPEDPEDENDNSIGIRLQYGSFSALLTGDSQARERAFWERHAPRLIRSCTVLKLAHHGSRNGTDARWLGMVRPQLAIASLGSGNEYGHPHPETLARGGAEDPPAQDGRGQYDHDPERRRGMGGRRPRTCPAGAAEAGAN